ncbi:hypothetical protein ABPG72_020016 [Tetrahymena utriculariae]
MSCCSINTVSAIIQQDSYDISDQRGHQNNRMIGENQEQGIKDLVIQKLQDELKRGVPVCTQDVRAWLKESNNISLSKKTLLNYLKNWGISWRRLQVDEYRKRRQEIKVLKVEFLHKMVQEIIVCTHVRKCKCPQQKQMVFLDESYIHEHHVSQYGLGIKDFPLQKQYGKGRRVVIDASISEQGYLGANLSESNWVSKEDGVYQNGSICAWIANVGGDYHLNFNAQNFTEYFQNCIHQYLTQPSIIVLDRAE